MSVTIDDVRAALPIVRRHFPPTPLLFARRLSERIGAEIWLKLDLFTPIRTFKLRGALVKIDRLPPGVGVATASAGNHGLAVAYAARAAGRSALVVVPERANPQKAESIAAQGAEVLRFGADYQAASDRSRELAAARGLIEVHAYDDPAIISGQGTLGLELPDGFDTLLVGIGGGGLISGIASAVAPRVRVIGVQPQGADSMARSLEASSIVSLDRVETIADGLGARKPGVLTFDLVRRLVDRVVRVSDRALLDALRVLLLDERLVAEPAGVAGLAALLVDPSLASGRTVVPITGGNVSDEVLKGVLHESSLS